DRSCSCGVWISDLERWPRDFVNLCYRPFGSSRLSSSSKSSLSTTGTAYTPESQRLRSTSAQRREQNGRKRCPAGLPQMGHGFCGAVGVSDTALIWIGASTSATERAQTGRPQGSPPPGTGRSISKTITWIGND